jgi:hypothetical protein
MIIINTLNGYVNVKIFSNFRPGFPKLYNISKVIKLYNMMEGSNKTPQFLIKLYEILQVTLNLISRINTIR